MLDMLTQDIGIYRQNVKVVNSQYTIRKFAFPIEELTRYYNHEW